MSPTRGGNRESNPMNATTDLATINRLARVIEDQEARRLGIPVKSVRVRIAKRLGIPPTALENLRRERTKVVPNWLMNMVRAEFISALQSEIQRHEHEIHIARQTGSNHRDDLLVSAEAQLEAARQILDEAMK